MKQNPFIDYQKIINETASKHYNVADIYKNNTYEENREICQNDRLPFSIGLINVTGDLNVGMCIRSACLMGASNFYIFGRKKYDKRSTVGAEKYINIVQYNYEDPLRADQQILDDLLKIGHPNLVCEQGGVELGSVECENEYLRIRDSHPLFLFGSESHGIPEIILNQTNNFTKVSIPQRGVLRSYNVSAAMNIIVWDYLRQTFI